MTLNCQKKVLLTNISTLDVIIPLMGATRCWASGFSLILSSEFLYLKPILILFCRTTESADPWIWLGQDHLEGSWHFPHWWVHSWKGVSSEEEAMILGWSMSCGHVWLLWPPQFSLKSGCQKRKGKQTQSSLAGPQARQNQGLDQYLPKKMVWRAKSGK